MACWRRRAPTAPHGISVDLSRELARRLDVPLDLVTFEAAGNAFEAAKASGLDVLFFAIEPVRAADVDFSPPYVLIEGTYMVPKDSPLKEIARCRSRRRAHRGRPRLGLRPLSHPHAQERQLVRAATGCCRAMIDLSAPKSSRPSPA